MSNSIGGIGIQTIGDHKGLLTINVQDTKRNLIEDAEVTIFDDSNNTFAKGNTNSKGCFSASIPSNTILNITISDTIGIYEGISQKFKLIPVSQLKNPLKNFPFLVLNSSTLMPISGADVEIMSDIHIDKGQTDIDGMYEGKVETSYENKVTINTAVYERTLNAFFPISCISSSFIIASVILI